MHGILGDYQFAICGGDIVYGYIGISWHFMCQQDIIMYWECIVHKKSNHVDRSDWSNCPFPPARNGGKKS